MAVKKRVFQVAREFSISNEALIEYLTKHGHDIRNHMSHVSEAMYAQVSAQYGEKIDVHPQDSDYEFRKRLRDKQAKEKSDSAKAREELEQKLRVSSELAEQKPNIAHKQAEEKRAKAEQAEKAARAKKAEENKSAEKEKSAAPVRRENRPKRKFKVVEIPSEGQQRSEKKKSEEHGKAGEAKKRTDNKQGGKQDSSEKPNSKSKPKSDKRDGQGQGERKGPQKGKYPDKKKHKPVHGKDGGDKVVKDEAKGGAKKDKRKKRKKKKRTFDEAEIKDNIRQTLAQMDDSGKSKKRKRKITQADDIQMEEAEIIKVSEFMSLSELANRMNVDASDLIKDCMMLGMMVSINQRLEMETIELLATDYGYQVEALAEFGEDLLDDLDDVDPEETLKPRPPVVTIMGHVDHGKTSLLDYIREANVIAGEAGGITQHIGAYEVDYNGKEITFLDTPGHEAFTAMRARGAQVTDLVVLVVAADDNVMPQTIEAISHAKAANVPIIVAINKIDKPNANPDMIRKQLSGHDVLVEQWGGKYQSVEISAKTGQSVDTLLESILVESEMLDFKANPDRKAKGVVIESKLDKGKGVVSTVLIQAGTLQVGDPFIAGQYAGKVRNMLDERGKRVKAAGPSCPVQILGFDGVPQSGDSFMVLNSERDTREISQKRQQLQREHEHWQTRPRTLDEISKQIKQGQVQQLGALLKADVDGSVEAIADSLQKLATDEVAVNVLHKGVGAITETDVLLASASGAIIIGFNVRPTVKARELASKENVDIRSYNVIYDIINDVTSALEGFLAPTLREEIVGTVEVRQTFKVPKIGTIAGCYVVSGKINRNDKIKLFRDNRLVHEGTISSLKRFKDDAREVASGFECGIGIERYNDLKVGDIIEVVQIIKEKRTL